MAVVLSADDYLRLVLAREAIQAEMYEGQAAVRSVAVQAEARLKAAQDVFTGLLKELAPTYGYDPRLSQDMHDADHSLTPERMEPTPATDRDGH